MSASSATDSASSYGRRLLVQFGPLLALAFVVTIFTVADSFQEHGGRFLSGPNFKNILIQSAVVAMAALGMTMIIIGGGIDLSAGTALALCGTVMAWCFLHDWSPPAAIAATILTGCATGALNGALIGRLRVVPFIITLGTMTIYLGVAKYIAKNTTVRPALNQVPQWMDYLLISVQPKWLFFPFGVWLVIFLAFFVAAILRFTVFGRHIIAMGSNDLAARLCGIRVDRTRVLLYSFAGLFVGLAGMLQFSRLSEGSPTSGTGKELAIIAAVVIGGGSLSGGRGSILGTLTGAVMTEVISNGCTTLGLRNELEEILLGAIIIAAVTIDQLRHRRFA
jgi:ribose transport system permease protein